jgi:hypothetical protein
MSTKKHEIPEDLLAGLLADYRKPKDLIGENGLRGGPRNRANALKRLLVSSYALRADDDYDFVLHRIGATVARGHSL